MATFYGGAQNQNDVPATMFLPASYSEPPSLGNIEMCVNPGSYADNVALSSQPMEQDTSSQQQKIVSVPQTEGDEFSTWRDGYGGMLVMHSMSDRSNIISNEERSQAQVLSLSLGTRVASGLEAAPTSYRNLAPEFTSFLCTDSSIMCENGGHNGSLVDTVRNCEYLLPYISQGNHVPNGDFTSYNFSNVSRIIPNSRYLRALQELLDEVVNVQKGIKRQNKGKDQSPSQCGMKFSNGSNHESLMGPSELNESTMNLQGELSLAERQGMQSKLNKLLNMLEEIDRRYREYYHRMQDVISSFDVVAGFGSAKRYTALALHAISRHFRSLRDALTSQIQNARNSLGEQESSDSKAITIARLRHVGRGGVHHQGQAQPRIWRPQRGLPESSVSILRAWMFEHFLHPYPKDSDKVMLARQTGLTRNQVSNWFINARVRLWKPMVEEMYKEEIGHMEVGSSASPDTVAKPLECNATNEANTSAVPHGDEMAGTDNCPPLEVPRHESCEATREEKEESAIERDLYYNANVRSDGHSVPQRSGPVSLTLGLQGVFPFSDMGHQSGVFSMVTSGMDTVELESISGHGVGPSHRLRDFVAQN